MNASSTPRWVGGSRSVSATYSENARFRGVALLPSRGGEAMFEQVSIELSILDRGRRGGRCWVGRSQLRVSRLARRRMADCGVGQPRLGPAPSAGATSTSARLAALDLALVASGDLDLPRLRPLRHRKGDVSTPPSLARGDVLGVDPRTEAKLAIEATLRPLGDENSSPSSGSNRRSAPTVRTWFSTATSIVSGSTPGRSRWTTNSSPRR